MSMAVRAYNDMSYVELDVKYIVVFEKKISLSLIHAMQK